MLYSCTWFRSLNWKPSFGSASSTPCPFKTPASGKQHPLAAVSCLTAVVTHDDSCDRCSRRQWSQDWAPNSATCGPIWERPRHPQSPDSSASSLPRTSWHGTAESQKVYYIFTFHSFRVRVKIARVLWVILFIGLMVDATPGTKGHHSLIRFFVIVRTVSLEPFHIKFYICWNNLLPYGFMWNSFTETAEKQSEYQI